MVKGLLDLLKDGGGDKDKGEGSGKAPQGSPKPKAKPQGPSEGYVRKEDYGGLTPPEAKRLVGDLAGVRTRNTELERANAVLEDRLKQPPDLSRVTSDQVGLIPETVLSAAGYRHVSAYDGKDPASVKDIVAQLQAAQAEKFDPSKITVAQILQIPKDVLKAVGFYTKEDYKGRTPEEVARFIAELDEVGARNVFLEVESEVLRERLSQSGKIDLNALTPEQLVVVKSKYKLFAVADYGDRDPNAVKALDAQLQTAQAERFDPTRITIEQLNQIPPDKLKSVGFYTKEDYGGRDPTEIARLDGELKEAREANTLLERANAALEERLQQTQTNKIDINALTPDQTTVVKEKYSLVSIDDYGGLDPAKVEEAVAERDRLQSEKSTLEESLRQARDDLAKFGTLDPTKKDDYLFAMRRLPEVLAELEGKNREVLGLRTRIESLISNVTQAEQEVSRYRSIFERYAVSAEEAVVYVAFVKQLQEIYPQLKTTDVRGQLERLASAVGQVASDSVNEQDDEFVRYLYRNFPELFPKREAEELVNTIVEALRNLRYLRKHGYHDIRSLMNSVLLPFVLPDFSNESAVVPYRGKGTRILKAPHL